MTTPGDGPGTARRRARALVIVVTASTLAAVGVVGVVAARVAGRNQAPRDTRSCSSGGGDLLREDTRFVAASGATVPFSISLPADYYRTCRTYPVLFVLHGKGQNNENFMGSALGMRRAMDAGALDQAIVVTPDSFSTGRWENSAAGPAEDNFIKFLIPYLEQTYRVEAGASHRLLAGFSMGGHGALRFGLKYPQMFAGVWSVDGAMSRQPTDYLPFVTGKSSGDFHIVAAGGQLNGSRVQATVETLKQAGVVIPYIYRDREHTFEAFVQEDEKAGWPAARFLQQQLGRPI